MAVAKGSNFVTQVGLLVSNAWSVSDIKEQRLWPNAAPADNHISRKFILDYNYQFISPGFIEEEIQ